MSKNIVTPELKVTKQQGNSGWFNEPSIGHVINIDFKVFHKLSKVTKLLFFQYLDLVPDHVERS